MAVVEVPVLAAECRAIAERARRDAGELATVPTGLKDAWLRAAAAKLRDASDTVLAANAQDVADAEQAQLTPAEIDRLTLTPARVSAIADALLEVAALRDPIGSTINSSVRPNGLEIRKVRVPLGVVLFIYESRPNVTVDAAALCVKSGNAVILRGGKEARRSNRALVDVLVSALRETGLPSDAVQLVETTDRAAVGHLLALGELIDVAIPRGGESLIRRVAAEAKMPVMKHFAGNCHVYVDRAADLAMAQRILVNSKCQRMGVCNAAESLLVHAEVAERFLPEASRELSQRGIELRGDARTCDLVPSALVARDEDYAAEFLGPILSVKVVDSLDEAVSHINRYGSHHTDAIVTKDLEAATQFTAGVDSAAVMVNASTRLHDGGQFGLGAEIGISTDKFHARGPCGLEELTSYKYIAVGQGQIRE